MKGKRITSALLSLALLVPVLTSFSGCASDNVITLRVYNWEEYIDEGGAGSYVFDSLKEELAPEMTDKEFEKWYAKNYDDQLAPPIIDDFQDWYEERYGEKVRVQYSTFGTNEDLYNQLKLGDKYDLVCPSEYMIMKLAAEGMLEPLGDEFLDPENEENYYINNVSDFIREKFANGTMAVLDEEKPVAWEQYAAGYMWGVTGIVYNPELVDEADLEQGWKVLLDSKYKNKVTTKDNVRDSYFVGLGIYYQDDLFKLKEQNENGELSDEEYTERVTELMNDVKPETVEEVTKILKDMKANIFGFETDTGKSDMVKGTISMNFAWSGDAVYAMDQAEGDEETPENQRLYLNYYIPEECANLFFDGWVMPKDEKRDEKTKNAALAFINYMSIPENAVRNSYYIGYTSVIAGEEMYEYIADAYGEDDGEDYDLSYFFGEGTEPIKTSESNRQLYAQYPPSETVKRCAVMNYYGEEEEAINELWTQVKGEKLDAWAIIVICVAAAAIVLFVVFTKFGHKIEFRLKPKKGYKLVNQEKLN